MYAAKSSLTNHKKTKHNDAGKENNTRTSSNENLNNLMRVMVGFDGDDQEEIEKEMGEALDEEEIINLVLETERAEPKELYSTVTHMVSGLWSISDENQEVYKACDECKKKEEVIQHKEESIDGKEDIIRGKDQQIRRLMTRVTKIAKEKAIMKKKVDNMEKHLFRKQKTIAF